MSSQQDRAYRQIREKILLGAIRTPRDLSRRRLATALNVEPSEVQWALRRMQSEGLLECRPQSGTFVRQITPEEYRNLHDLRRLIEPYAAARAARLITPEQIARLDEVVREMAEVPNDLAQLTAEFVPTAIVEKVIRLEVTFHGTIMAAAKNPEAMRIIEHAQVFTHMTRYFPEMERAALIQDANQSFTGHRSILDAIRRGRAKQARRLMREHLADGLTLPCTRRISSVTKPAPGRKGKRND